VKRGVLVFPACETTELRIANARITLRAAPLDLRGPPAELDDRGARFAAQLFAWASAPH
jgi:hypothetical protein